MIVVDRLAEGMRSLTIGLCSHAPMDQHCHTRKSENEKEKSSVFSHGFLPVAACMVIRSSGNADNGWLAESRSVRMPFLPEQESVAFPEKRTVPPVRSWFSQCSISIVRNIVTNWISIPLRKDTRASPKRSGSMIPSE